MARSYVHVSTSLKASFWRIIIAWGFSEKKKSPFEKKTDWLIKIQVHGFKKW